MSYIPPSSIDLFLYWSGTLYTPPSSTNLDLFWSDDGGGGIVESLVDHVALSEVVFSIDTYSISDTVALSETIQKFFGLDYYDTVVLNETLATGDIVLKWRGRTKESLKGMGGLPYGDVGYGIGKLTDISGYYLEVWNNTTGLLKRTVEFTITDQENPDIDWAYSKTMNVADNTTYTTNLTFYIYQVSSDGVRSIVKQLTLS